MRNLSRARRAAIAAFVALPLTATAAHAWVGTSHHATTADSVHTTTRSTTRNVDYADSAWIRHDWHTSAPSMPAPTSSPSTSEPSSAPSTSSATTAPSTTASTPTTAPSTSTPSSTATAGTTDTSPAGVPAGTTLTPSGSVTVNTDGAVIDGLDISGTLTVNASNVTVKNTRVRSGSAFWVVSVKGGATNVKFDHVTVAGGGTSGTEGASGVVGPGTFNAVDVSQVENGFVPGNGSVISDSYVHDLWAPGSPHYDGVQIDGNVNGVQITGSTISNNQTQTSAIMVDNYDGPATNIVVDGNRLVGGGYTVYADGSFSSSSQISVAYTNNRISGGYYGADLLRDSNVTWSGNVDDKTGAAISGS